MGLSRVKRGPYKPSSNTGHKGITKVLMDSRNPNRIGKYTAHIYYRSPLGNKEYRDRKMKSIQLGDYDTLEEAIQVRKNFIDNLY